MAVNRKETRRANVKGIEKDASEKNHHVIDIFIQDGNEKTSIKRYFASEADKQTYIAELKGMNQ